MANSFPNNTKREANYSFTNGLNLATSLGNGVNLTSSQLNSLLRDGTVTKQGSYGAVMTRSRSVSTSYWGFELYEKSRVWAVGNVYSDSGGYTGKGVDAYKLNLSTGNYELYSSITSTKTDGEWYVLFEELEEGNYRLSSTDLYFSVDEIYFEYLNTKKFLLKSNNKTFSLKPINTLYKANMTANSSPSPLVASASSEYNTTYQAWKAFNGTNTGSTDCWITASGVRTGYLQLDFSEKTRVNKILLASRTNDGNITAPKDFNVEGSNDGINFNIINSFTGISSWTAGESKLFEIKTSNYRFYRINILSNNGSTSYVSIAMLNFYYKSTYKIELPELSTQNMIKYGMDSSIQLDSLLLSKNYILQDTVSENEEGLWTTQLTRKPLSISFN